MKREMREKTEEEIIKEKRKDDADKEGKWENK